jgi:hypothetical protein
MADSLLSRAAHCEELSDLVEILRLSDSEVVLAKTVSERRLANARLGEIRARQLQYLPSYIEPLDAMRWLERGGKPLEGAAEERKSGHEY